jgi:AcrR family transcriptional regulator
MARPIPPERLSRLLETATKTFVARGYRLTQMANIAEALDVAKGTLYGYVESKEALFDAAVRYADEPPETLDRLSLPLPTPARGKTVAYIREQLAKQAGELELVRFLNSGESAENSKGEFERILRDLYRRMAKHRRALKLVDRCAVDHPELASVWFKEGRWAQVALLTEYLQSGLARGHIRPVPNLPIAARMILETIALWAIHMPWDPSPQTSSEADAESAVIDMLQHAYVQEAPR